MFDTPVGERYEAALASLHITRATLSPDAGHAWINWLLTPEISIRDLEFHGYHSGMKNIDKLIAELAPDLTRAEMIFFTDEQVATMQTGAVNSAQDRIVEIYDKIKAKAAG